jgi:hypothetical protein
MIKKFMCMKTKTMLTFAACTLAASSAFAEFKVELSGTVDVSAPADFFTVEVQVVSQCYDTTKQVLTAADGVSARISEILSKYKTSSTDLLLTWSGSPQRIGKVVLDNSLDNEVVCKNKYHVTHRVVLEFSEDSKWSDLRAEVLQFADDVAQAETGYGERTLVSISDLRPELYFHNHERLKRKAVAESIAKATKVFDSARHCSLSYPRVVSMKLAPAHGVASSEVPARISSSRDTPEFNLNFEDLLFVNETWTVTWEFTAEGYGCSFWMDSEKLF